MNIPDNKENEIEIITKIITHPAGFNIGLFGDLLTIRSHCDGYEVAWIDYADGTEIKSHKNFSPDCIKEAVKFFVEKRHKYQLGIDFETSLMQKKIELNNEINSKI